MKAPFGGSTGDLNADRRYGLAMQLLEERDFQAAADLLQDCIELAPDWPPLYFHLGCTLLRLDQPDAAENALRRYLALDAEDKMGAGIKLALMGRADPDTAMSAQYVTFLFDQYAPSFEKALVEKLQYHVPEHMAALLPNPSYQKMLDIGCGTGLGGVTMRSRVRNLTGIDIAPGMITQARQKKIYDALFTISLENFLKETSETFDLVFCADVLVYMGPLENVFALISQKMERNGHFVFSVQHIAGDEWALGPDHRYAHSVLYLERCAIQAGLTIQAGLDLAIRLDQGLPVAGHIMVLVKI